MLEAWLDLALSTLEPAREETLEAMTRGIVEFAVRCGDMRLDRITFANVGALGTKSLSQ